MKTLGFSLFDLDTTLYKGESGYVIIDLANKIARQRSDEEFITKRLKKLDLLYKEKDPTKRIDRTTFAIGVIDVLYGRCFADPYDIDEVKKLIIRFWEEKKGTGWYPYADDLVALMQQYTKTILITGSPAEAMGYVQERFHFGEGNIFATKGYTKRGAYTGKSDELASPKAKEKLALSLRKQFNFKKGISFAFGDSDSDEPLFGTVAPENCFVLVERNKLENNLPLREWVEKVEPRWKVVYDDQDIIGIVKSRVQQVFA